MPASASAWATSFSASLWPAIGLLPSRSVGPEPETIKATSGCGASPGRSSVPCRVPVAVSSCSISSAAKPGLASSDKAVAAAARAVRIGVVSGSGEPASLRERPAAIFVRPAEAGLQPRCQPQAMTAMPASAIAEPARSQAEGRMPSTSHSQAIAVAT